MRKFLVSLLVVTLAITMFGTVAFAANDYDVYFTDPAIDYENGTATAYLVLAPQANGLFSASFDKTVSGATVTLTDTGALKALDSAMTLNDMGLFGFTGSSGISETTTALNIVKFDISRAGDAKTASITITQGEFYDGNGDEATLKIKPLSFSWEKATSPEVSNKKLDFDKDTFGDYKDVPCFNGSATITGSYSNVKLGFDLYNGTTFHKTINPVAISTTDGSMTIDNGTIKFKVAVVGAPTDADVQIKNIVVNAE